MLLRMSTLFLRTLREDPAEAEVPSHRLLLRAGYIRRAAPGGFTWLPLGMLVRDRITAIVREEMTAIGGQEVAFPALLPREPYEASGRWTEYGSDIFTLKDRRGADYLLGPTHEEMFTSLVRDTYSSYRDYPVILYQVQSKYRDEPRPRAGLLRLREFLMKDSYSFDLDDAGLAAAYDKHRAAYQRIFDRLELRYTIVAAMSGRWAVAHPRSSSPRRTTGRTRSWRARPAATPRTPRRSARRRLHRARLANIRRPRCSTLRTRPPSSPLWTL